MKQLDNVLDKLIRDFISDKVTASLFEEQFTKYFDFDDIDFKDPTHEMLFTLVRQLLERYTPYNDDIINHPQYYLDEQQLKEKIAKVVNEWND